MVEKTLEQMTEFVKLNKQWVAEKVTFFGSKLKQRFLYVALNNTKF